MTPAQEAKIAKMRVEYATIREAKIRAEEILVNMPDGIEKARFRGYIDNMQRQMDYIKSDADRIKNGEPFMPKQGSIACIECGNRVYSCEHIIGRTYFTPQ